jgi:hypothetical protein
MKRLRRISRERLRRFRMIQNEGPGELQAYQHSPFWQAISDEIHSEVGNDNILEHAARAEEKEGR